METLTNLEIAHRQLERAISLFMAEQDYVSALTLAGAAEEVLGKLLNNSGKQHWLDEIMAGALEALGFVNDAVDSAEAKQVRREIANSLNQYKNRFKHSSDEDPISLHVDVKAAEMIDRAISNYWELTRQETQAMKRFKREVLRR